MMSTPTKNTTNHTGLVSLPDSAPLRSSALAAVNIGIWHWDIVNNRYTWDASQYAIFGVSPEEFEISLETVWAATHPDDRQRLQQLATNALKTGQPYKAEFRIIRPDGEIRTCIGGVSVVLDATGQPVQMSGTTYDISERSRAEAALRESEEWLRALIENLPGGAVFVVDQDLRYLTADGEALYSAGVQPNALIGKSIHEVLEPALVTAYIPYYRQALAGQRFFHEHESHGRSYITRGVPLRDPAGKVYAALAVSYDITARKQAEDALRRAAASDAYRVQLADTLRPLTRATDIQAQASQVLGQHLGANRVQYGEISADGESMLIERDYVNGTFSVVGRFQLRDFGVGPVARIRSGEALVVSDVAHDPLLSDAEKATYAAVEVAAHISVPLIKFGRFAAFFAVQQVVPRAWTPDEVALVEETAERVWLILEKVRLDAEAQEAIHIRDQFLSIAAHELKTPLTALLGFSQMLQRRIGDTLGEREARMLRQTNEQAQRLNRLIDALLDVGRIESGQLSIERVSFNLTELLQQVVSAIEPTLDRHRLVLIGADAPVMLHGDALRLEQVIHNLVSNAVKYNPDGGSISITLAAHPATVQILVSDRGMGIPRAAIPNLFQRFYRVENNRTRHIAGVGIGLFVVKEIVSLHGGTVTVESTEGVGSTFTVTLPRG